MRAFIKLIGLGLFLMLCCSGCTSYHYEKALCDEKNLADIPNLEGMYVSYSEYANETEYEFSENEFEIKRIGKGLYSTNSDQSEDGEFKTCVINGLAYAEVHSKYKNPVDEKEVSGNQLVSLNVTSEFVEMMTMIFDPNDLMGRVPFRLVDNMLTCLSQDYANILNLGHVFRECKNPITSKYLVIENQNSPAATLASLGNEQIISIRSYRRNSK